MALSDHTLIAAYPLGSGIADLQDSYDGYSAQNMTFAGDGDLSGLPVADFNSSYYGIDNDLYNGFDTEYSFSMWLKPETIGGGQKAVMVNEQHGSYYSTFGVYLTDDGQLYLFVRNANGGAYDIAYTGVSLVVDEWSHVVATWSGTEIKWYVDGALVSTTSASRVPWNSPATLWIGANATKADKQYYDGKMSDLRFWYSELTASDVAELHAAGQVPIDLGIIHKWSLDTDGSAEVGSVDLVAHNSATHIDNVGSLPEIGSGFHPATSIALNPSAGYTISTWFKGIKSNAWNQFVAGGSSGTDGNFAGSTAYYDIAFDSTDLYVWDQTSPYYRRSGYDIMSDTNLDTGWHHIVAAYDGTQTTFYVDGVQVGNPVTWSGSPSIQTFGSWKNFADRAPADFMDDIRVWSRTLSASEISTLHAAGAGESSGEALIDITYGGQLSGVRAFDHNGSVFCYITEESEAPSVYFGTDLSDFASFEKKTIINELSQPMSLEGKPMSLSMKSDDGSIYLGTSSGKLYHVAYDAGTNCVAKELHDAAEGVRKVHWDSHRSECLFEADGVIHSVDLSETVLVKHSLAAGSMVEDFKAAPAGVAIVFRKADFTFEVMFVEGTNWASPKASSQMIESVRAARDFEYNSDLDMWVAAGSTGQISVATLF
jgi:hypothetical protein